MAVRFTGAILKDLIVVDLFWQGLDFKWYGVSGNFDRASGASLPGDVVSFSIDVQEKAAQLVVNSSQSDDPLFDELIEQDSSKDQGAAVRHFTGDVSGHGTINVKLVQDNATVSAVISMSIATVTTSSCLFYRKRDPSLPPEEDDTDGSAGPAKLRGRSAAVVH